MSARFLLTDTTTRRVRALVKRSVVTLSRLKRSRGRTQLKRFSPRFDRAHRVLLNLPLKTAGEGAAPSDVDAVKLLTLRKYLQGASRPRFFADAPELAAAARRVSTLYPSWRQRTLASVQRDRREGLPIYGERGPALCAGFPWGAVPPGPGADVLHSVRPHRFAFAPRWALAVLYGQPVVGEFLRLVEDWMAFAASRDNKLAYLSNLVVVQRMLSTTWAWAYLSACEHVDDDHRRLELRLLQILTTDLEFLQPRFGHSFPNNHLLVDRFARWFASVVWPELTGDASARELHEQAWVAEWERQILPDGAGFEHAQHYHEFACEMAVAYLALSRRNGWRLDPRARDRTYAMLRFQVDANGTGASPLAFGNGTEDPLFPLDTGEAWGSAALQQVLAVWFEPARRLPPADRVDRERAFWLLGGDSNAEPFASGASIARSGCAVYPDGGIVVLPDSDPATRLVLRTGPAPGRPICAGHAHADLLSVYVDVEAAPIIVDAGSFSYRGTKAPWEIGEPAWRRYFAGPASHNGLAIADADPLGTINGDFRPNELQASVEMQTCHVQGGLRRVEAVVNDAGPYSGYRRGVIHVLDRYWLVYDVMPSRNLAPASFGFQAAPKAVVETMSGCCTTKLRVDTARLTINHAAGLSSPSMLRGQTVPPAGWVSPAYGSKVPAVQLRYHRTAECAVTAFVMIASDRPRPREIEAIGVVEGGCAFRLRFDDRVDYLLASDRNARAAWSAFGLRFWGATALWSVSEDGSGRLNWVEGHMLEAPGLRVQARAPSGLALLAGRLGDRGFEWEDGMQAEVESWMKDERSPNR